MWLVYEVPFERVAHLVTVPVTLNGVETAFVFDSGIGVTLVRRTGACVTTAETFTGRRMSGQAVPVPLATAPSLAFAGLEQTDVSVGVLDLTLPPELDHIGGFLSLAFFAEHAVTIDYPRGVVRIGGGDGTELDVRVERDGPSVGVHLPLTIPGGEAIEVEVDMGSDALILDERFAQLAGEPERVVEGVDETGNTYRRSFATLRGSIHPTAAPELAQEDPDVMFQSIVYDGLVGDAFLRRYAVTFDVAASRLVLSRG